MEQSRSLRIGITGGAGLLASNFVRQLQSDYFVLTLFNKTRPVGHQKRMVSADVSSKKELYKVLSQYEIDCLVHAAALTDVDRCEAYPELAMRVNFELAQTVSEVCLELGIKLVFISTDQVFEGVAQNYSEDDDVFPINIYGKTKALAEDYLRHQHGEALILRTNFFGWGPPHRQSFSDWVITSLRREQPIKLFTNINFTPVYSSFLVDRIMDLVLKGARGIYNVSSDRQVSKWEFGNRLATRLGIDAGCLLKYEFKNGDLLAPRPANMCLSNLKIKRFLGLPKVELSHQLISLLNEESLCYDWMN